MAGKITSMSKIKQVLIMHRNGMSNRKIASALGIDKCTVNEYVRKARTCTLSLRRYSFLEGQELEAQMFAGNPAYTDERMKQFLEKPALGLQPPLKNWASMQHVAFRLM